MKLRVSESHAGKTTSFRVVAWSGLKRRLIGVLSGPRRLGEVTFTMAAVLILVFVTGCNPTPPMPPTDAQDLCQLPAATFNTWFQSGSVTLNGVVVPANSLNSPTPNCGFYSWSEQMFLWLTSPAPSIYGGGDHIFNSPAFFDVSPPDASGHRTFLPHVANQIRPFPLPLRVAQRGPHGLPVIMDRSKRLFEIAPPTANAKPMVRDQSGKIVEVAHAKLADGRLTLIDPQGNIIAHQISKPGTPAGEQKPMEQKPAQGKKSKAGADIKAMNPLLATRFFIDGIPILFDPSLDVIDVEQGQADSSVLEAQTTANGSLVYYATMVNDVYAYFLTGAKDGAITTSPSNQFPTSSTDLNNTINFAIAHGKPNPPFPDPNALAIEIKTAWVEATNLPNLSSYITMTATIPTYTQTSSTVWTQSGQQTVQLALVGMHVVGSTAGHPEMVWATFEHAGNTPIASYSYNSTSGPKTINPSSFAWLFAASNATSNFNQPHMTFTPASPPTPATINAISPFTISPSDTNRVEPWGVDGLSSAFSNTQVISMNSHVLSMLASGDVRGNYVMTGATWTKGGSNPVPVAIPPQCPSANNGVGTNLLANTTMETYQQGASNCFSCHSNFCSAPNATTDISHVYPGLQPLF
jgi:hypothetical protein